MKICRILVCLFVGVVQLTEATFWLYNLFDSPRYVETNYQRAMANLREIAIEKRRLQLLGLYPIVVSTNNMRSEDLNGNDYYDDYNGDYLTSDYDFEREYDERMYEILRRSNELRSSVRRKQTLKPKKIKEMYITKNAKSDRQTHNAYRVKGIAGEVFLQNRPDYKQMETYNTNNHTENTNRRLDMDISNYEFVDNAIEKNTRKDNPITVVSTIGFIKSISNLTTTSSTTSVPPIDNMTTTSETSSNLLPITDNQINNAESKKKGLPSSINESIDPSKRRFDLDININYLVDNPLNKDKPKTVLTAIGIINALSRLTTTSTTTPVPPIDNMTTTESFSASLPPITENIINYEEAKLVSSDNLDIFNLRMHQYPVSVDQQIEKSSNLTLIDCNSDQLETNESSFYDMSSEYDILLYSEEMYFSTTPYSIITNEENHNSDLSYSYDGLTKPVVIKSEDIFQPQPNDNRSIKTTTEISFTPTTIPELTIQEFQSPIIKQSPPTSPSIINELQFPSDKDHADAFFDNQSTINNVTSIPPTTAIPTVVNSTTKIRIDIDNSFEEIVYVDEEEPLAPPSFMADFHKYRNSQVNMSTIQSLDLLSEEYGISDLSIETTTLDTRDVFNNEIVETTTSEIDLTERTTIGNVNDVFEYMLTAPEIYDWQEESEVSQSNSETKVNNGNRQLTSEHFTLEPLDEDEKSSTVKIVLPTEPPTVSNIADTLNSDSLVMHHNSQNVDVDQDSLFYKTDYKASSNISKKPEPELEKSVQFTQNELADKEVDDIISKIDKLVTEAQHTKIANFPPADYDAVHPISDLKKIEQVSKDARIDLNSKTNYTDNLLSHSTQISISDVHKEETNTFPPNISLKIDEISGRINEIIENSVFLMTSSDIPMDLVDEEGWHEMKELVNKTLDDEYNSSEEIENETEIYNANLLVSGRMDLQSLNVSKSSFLANNSQSLLPVSISTDNIISLNSSKESETPTENKNSRKDPVDLVTPFDTSVTEPSARNLVEKPSDYRRSDVLAESEYANYDADPIIDTDDPISAMTIDEMTQLNQLKLIPLIPVLIEQLRLGRVSDAEMEILQQIFGAEFWQLILSEVENNTSLTEMNSTLAKIMHEKQQIIAKPPVMQSIRRKRNPTFRRLRNERRLQNLLVRRLELDASRSQWNNDGRAITLNIGLNDGVAGRRRRPTFNLDY